MLHESDTSDIYFVFHPCKYCILKLFSVKILVFLITQMADRPTDLWIGLCKVNDGPYHWLDGQPQKYTNFGVSINK